MLFLKNNRLNRQKFKTKQNPCTTELIHGNLHLSEQPVLSLPDRGLEGLMNHVYSYFCPY